jgi:hypothetical protein
VDKNPAAASQVMGRPEETMKKLASLLLLFVLAGEVCWAVGGGNTMYVGGTIDIKQGIEGKSSAKDQNAFVFEYKIKKEMERLSIPYDRIDSLEYGQKAGRRLGAAVLVNPMFILSHKRKHYLTVGYTDENDKQQAVVLELGKDVVRTTLATLEARSGRKIEYQDEEARHSGRGN